jgi:hypothetical protein
VSEKYHEKRTFHTVPEWLDIYVDDLKTRRGVISDRVEAIRTITSIPGKDYSGRVLDSGIIQILVRLLQDGSTSMET